MAAHPRFISAFDLDRTILAFNSSFRFSLQLVFRKKIPCSTLLYSVLYYLRHTMGTLSLLDMHKKIFAKHLHGYSLLILKEEVRRFMRKLKTKDFYQPALEHFRQAKKKEHYTVLLSSSPDFLVRPLGEMLGFDETFASLYLADAEHRLSSIASILDGEGKGMVLHTLCKKLGISQENTVAYSDSHLDIPFLKAAGQAVAVHPDRKLQAYAKKKGWITL